MKRSVLVIESEQLVREALEDILDTVGLHVIGVDNGPEGLATYQARHQEIDLVILDMRLPEMDGLALLKALRAIDPAVKAILSTGYDEDEVAQWFSDYPPPTILRKPYNADRLLAKVREAQAT